MYLGVGVPAVAWDWREREREEKAFRGGGQLFGHDTLQAAGHLYGKGAKAYPIGAVPGEGKLCPKN